VVGSLRRIPDHGRSPGTTGVSLEPARYRIRAAHGLRVGGKPASLRAESRYRWVV
jgi:hypothetical protein